MGGVVICNINEAQNLLENKELKFFLNDKEITSILIEVKTGDAFCWNNCGRGRSSKVELTDHMFSFRYYFTQYLLFND